MISEKLNARNVGRTRGFATTTETALRASLGIEFLEIEFDADTLNISPLALMNGAIGDSPIHPCATLGLIHAYWTGVAEGLAQAAEHCACDLTELTQHALSKAQHARELMKNLGCP